MFLGTATRMKIVIIIHQREQSNNNNYNKI